MGLTTVLGAGGGTISYEDFHKTDFILLVGANVAEAHPVIFHHVMKGVHRGALLVVVDPRKNLTTRRAHEHLALRVGSDIALLNAMGHVIIRDGLYRKAFIDRATTGFDDYRHSVSAWSPQRAEAITGIPADQIKAVAREFAQAGRAIIGWTLGITEHHNAVDNVYALVNLALLTGNVGRPGTGLSPFRGQNNVQGGGDMGALPNRLPGFQDLKDAEVRKKFEQAWGTSIDARPGLDQSQMFEAMNQKTLTGLYVIGENPVQSEANSNHVKKLFKDLDALIVQDIFLTPTAEMADVVLPARVSFAESDGTFTNSERRVQRVRAARKAPGEAQDDIWIITQLARAMGHPWPLLTAVEVFDEMRRLSPNFAGMTYDRIDREGGLQWPCPDENHRGAVRLHERLWQDSVGPLAPFIPVEWEPPAEPTTPEFPFTLTTGRRLAFYNTGVQTQHYPHPDQTGEHLDINPSDAASLHLDDGQWVRIRSRRGSVVVPVHLTGSVNPGTVFLSFHFSSEVPTNVLAIDATDPVAGTAEFKAAAVAIEMA